MAIGYAEKKFLFYVLELRLVGGFSYTAAMISRKLARLLGEAYTLIFSTKEVRPRGSRTDIYKQFIILNDKLRDFLYDEKYPDWLLYFLNVQSNPTNERILKERIMGFHTGEAFNLFKNPHTDMSPEARRTAGQDILRSLVQSIFRLGEKTEQTEQASQLLNELKSQLELDGYVYRNGTLYAPETSVIDEQEEPSYAASTITCRCENSGHANHAGGPCTAVATESDNYCKSCHDKAADEAMAAMNVPTPRVLPDTSRASTSRNKKNAIEIRTDDDKWEHSLCINGSMVENAVVHDDAVHKGFFYLYSDFDEVTYRLLPHSLADFLEAGIKDIHVPFGVSWNEAIGALGIKYEIVESASEGISSLEIEFGRVARWFGREYPFDEYYRTLHNNVELSKLAGVEMRETESYHEPPAIVFSINKTLPLTVEVERCLNTLRSIHDKVVIELRADINSLEVAFDFPEEVRVPCEQYLLYFGEFLADVGVKVTTNIRYEAGQVLFAVTPEDKETALDKIYTALGEYLNLARAPVSEASIVSIADQRLAANVDHLKGQLRLKNAELQLAHATIQTQQVAIAVLKGDVLLESVKDVTPNKNDDKESFLGGTVALKAFNYKGVEVNYPEIFRKLRQLFKKDRD